jgi:hypothetical protein
MPFIIVSLVIQALLIVHCIKTGRNQIWIWVLALLSYAGIIAYIAAELLPDLLRSRTTQRTVQGVKKALDPEADLRRLAQRAEISGGVDGNQRYAEELLRLGRPAAARVRYAQLLRTRNQPDQAIQRLRVLLNQAAVAPPHYRRTQEEWLKQAERELAAL